MLDAQSELAPAFGGMSSLGETVDHGQGGAGAETGGFANLLSSILAAPSSGALLLANAKPSATSPGSPTGLKPTSAQATTLLLATPPDPDAADVGAGAQTIDDAVNAQSANDADPGPAKPKDDGSDPGATPAPGAMADAMLPAAATLQLLASLVSAAPPPPAPAPTPSAAPPSGQEPAIIQVGPSFAPNPASQSVLANTLATSAGVADAETAQTAQTAQTAGDAETAQTAAGAKAAQAAAGPAFATPSSAPASPDASSAPQAASVLVQPPPVIPTPAAPTLVGASAVQLAAQVGPPPVADASPQPPVAPPPAPAASPPATPPPAAVQDTASPVPPPDPTSVALAASGPQQSLSAATGSASAEMPIAQTHAATSSTGPHPASATAPPMVAQLAASGGASNGAPQDGSGDRPHGDQSQAAAPAPRQAFDPGAAGALTAAAPAAAIQTSSQPVTVSGQTVSRLASGIVQNLKSKSSRFQLALEPAGLGRVDISVRIGADGALSATLNFNSPQAADALKAHAGELRAALQQAGFNLGGSDLSFMTGNSSQQQGGSQGQSAGRPSFASTATPDSQAAPPAHAAQTVASSADGLDIRI